MLECPTVLIRLLQSVLGAGCVTLAIALLLAVHIQLLKQVALLSSSLAQRGCQVWWLLGGNLRQVTSCVGSLVLIEYIGSILIMIAILP